MSVLEAARASNLIRSEAPLLVMLSGGPDSVCLLDVSLRLGADVQALHVNYGLRPGADEDEAHCRALCERLGVALVVEQAGPRPAGNLQGWARELRYALAERHARGDYAAAHTASDQAETAVYRLAVSPGRRALVGMAPRRGRLVRPLLEVTREDVRAYCHERGLDWRDDPSNEDRRFARARIRGEVMRVLTELNPAAELNVAETMALLRDEQEVLDRAVDEALERLGRAGAVELAALRREPAGLARLVLRRLAETAVGGPRSLSRADVDAVLALGGRGGSQALDLGGGLRAVAEYGTLRFSVAPDAPAPEAVELTVPGSARFGEWQLEARIGEGGEVELDAAVVGAQLTVRSWEDGDRLRPLGLGGTKSLQDLFTDRKVPRALRRTLPVVVGDDEIAWVPGVVIGERFAAGDADEVISLTAKHQAH